MTVIPNFIIKRLYVPGSLRLVPEGVAFDLRNVLGPGILTRINSIKVGPVECLASEILLKVQDRLIPATDISESSPVAFTLNQTVTCILKGEFQIPSGVHTITMDVWSKEAGKILISVQDHLTGEQT